MSVEVSRLITTLEIPPTAVTSDAVLRCLAAQLIERGELAADQLELVIAGLLQRESLGSTNIGCEVAVPHLVTPAVVGTAIVMGRLSTPLIWSGGDVEPVRRVYLALVADRGDHLGCLERISQHLQAGDDRA
jgi:mannitol/fructose-specific phosphotransferase system IIA component (Ntr-type)